MSDPPLPFAPPLEPGDVYVYAHRNGALSVVYADGRSLLAPLAEVRTVVEGCDAAGCRVVVGGADAPLAVDALTSLGTLGVPLEPFGATVPPLVWHDGTDALMQAVAVGFDALLDDLIERGADIRHRDDTGATALHHAARNGNLHAIDALVAAGADLDDARHQGFTPLALAEAHGQAAAADRLRSHAGPGPARGPDGDDGHAFGIAHVTVRYLWVSIIPALALVLLTAVTTRHVGLIIGTVVFLVALAWLLPGPAHRAGGAPRRLDGTVLTLRHLTGRRTIDLALAGPVAGIAGNLETVARGRPRTLLLAHPDGYPVSERGLRRLRVPAADLPLLRQHLDRVVVVSLDGGRAPEVLVPIGDLLAGRDVTLTDSLRAQIAWARTRIPPDRTA